MFGGCGAQSLLGTWGPGTGGRTHMAVSRGDPQQVGLLFRVKSARTLGSMVTARASCGFQVCSRSSERAWPVQEVSAL